MMTANFNIPAKPLECDQGLKGEHLVATVQPSSTRAKVEAGPEKSLWKVCADAASPRISAFEWVAFLLFGAVSLGALAYGFSELFHFFNNGALDETVRALLTR